MGNPVLRAKIQKDSLGDLVANKAEFGRIALKFTIL